MNRQSACALPIGRTTAFESDLVASHSPSRSIHYHGIKLALTHVQFIGQSEWLRRWKRLIAVIAKQESEMTAVLDAIASESEVPATATGTHCPYCALQCGMTLTNEGGSITVSRREFPTTNGRLCQKGWTAAELLSNGDRLTTPMIREHRSYELRPASWDEALARVAAEFTRAQE